MKVLIVDGSKQRRQELVESLGDLTNVIVQGAVADVRTALLAVADASPDVVITGALLPDGDGTQLIENLRRLEHQRTTVVVTSVTSPEQRTRYLAAGADRCVDSEDELRSALASLVRTRRSASGSIPPVYTLELLGRMVTGVVHDLNNYVGVLEVMLQLLQRHPQDDALWTQTRAALSAVRRLDETLLEYARGGSPAPTILDLSEVVTETVGLAGRLIPPGIRVQIASDPGGAVLRAVRSDLEQLVLNLVVNACDAMGSDGDLVLTVTRVPYGVMLEVSDSGAGEVSEPVAGVAASAKHSGFGLGLGIVHAVVQRHGGAIRIVPRDEGGTLIAVMLPEKPTTQS